MTEPTKLPVKKEKAKTTAPATHAWHAPIQNLRREIERLFELLDGGVWAPFRNPLFDIRPYWLRESSWKSAPAVDIVETQKNYEITADLPGFDEKDIEVKVANGCLSIKGEKQEETEEKRRTIIFTNGHSVHSNAALGSPTAWTPIRWTPISRREF